MALLLCVFLAASAAHNGFTQVAEPHPDSHRLSFELDSDMLRFDALSASFWMDWQRTTDTLFAVGLDGASGALGLNNQDRWFGRFTLLAAFSAAGTVASRAFSITAHDARHMEAARAIGSSSVGLVRSDNGQSMTIGEFFLESFNPTIEAGLYFYTKVNPTPAEMAYVAGVGLDTNMLIADSISTRIDQGEGHVTDCAPYVLNKLWGVTYFLETGPTSDAGNYMGILNGQGWSSVTRDSVISLNVVSFLLSGGFLSLAKGAFDYVVDARSTVRPLGISIDGVRVFWPELTTWLNPQCVSLQVSVDAAWQDRAFVRLGVDSPVLGNIGTPEVTIGATVWLARLGLGMELTSHFQGVPFLKGSMEYRFSDVLSAGIEGFYGQRNTMRELREYPEGPGAVGYLKARL
jgi:hypothetical protein